MDTIEANYMFITKNIDIAELKNIIIKNLNVASDYKYTNYEKIIAIKIIAGESQTQKISKVTIVFTAHPSGLDAMKIKDKFEKLLITILNEGDGQILVNIFKYVSDFKMTNLV